MNIQDRLLASLEVEKLHLPVFLLRKPHLVLKGLSPDNLKLWVHQAPFYPAYQGGGLFRIEQSYEHSYESETK